MNKIGLKNGFFSFLLVLLLMPIGHAVMVLNEIVLYDHKLIGAAILGLIGVGLLVWGFKKNHLPSLATIMGFLGGVLVWTGWVEFSFVWIAEKNGVAPFVENGSVATKPEYLVMLSSVGLLATVTLFYIFTKNSCNAFIWVQKIMGMRKDIVSQSSGRKPWALSTFSETIMILWFFYIMLLVVYDPQIAGDRHIATYIVGWGSLVWSLYLIAQLVKIQSFDYAVRYAIPTVIIFWNFVEVLGRWGTFKEVWIYPIEHWLEVSIFVVILAVLLTLFFKLPSFKRQRGLDSKFHHKSPASRDV